MKEMSNRKADWQESSVLYLEHEQTHLYGELIQLLPQQQRVWIRPLAIKTNPDSPLCKDFPESVIQLPDPEYRIFDLRNTADLIWPTLLFQHGFDYDVIPILASLQRCSPSNPDYPENCHIARKILNQFLRGVWATHSASFPSLGTISG